MSSAVIMLQGGPAHGTFHSIPSPFPVELKVPVPIDNEPIIWDPNQLTIEEMVQYEVAVYRKGWVEPPAPPQRSSTGVYYFSCYEGTKY